MRRLVTLWIAAVLGMGAAPRPAAGAASSPIVNGTLTAQHPSTGLLFVATPDGDIGMCSGVLIACGTFLTAAHCFCGGVPGSSCQGSALTDPANALVFFQHIGFADVAQITVHPSFPGSSGSDPTAGDLALVRLGAFANGLTPTPINTVAAPAAGTRGTIVGFGRTGGDPASNRDSGLKRVGDVVTGPCAGGISDTTGLCWTFSGAGSNTCNGDSGGPLFVDFGSGPLVAGITSGGTSASCLPTDSSFDTNVYAFRSWIASNADLTVTTCGDLAPAGGAGAITGTTGSFDPGASIVSFVFGVSPGAQLLAATLNGQLGPNADLYLKAGAPATPVDYDCRSRGDFVFEACRVTAPRAGSWFARVQGISGSGDFQLTATAFGGDTPVCGNGLHEPGEECDGGDAPTCVSDCDATCRCLQCSEGFTLTNYTLGSRFLLKGLLTGAAALDPRRTDLRVAITDRAGTTAEIQLPASTGWRGKKKLYRWRGRSSGIRKVTLRRRGGAWLLAMSGRDVPGVAKLSSPLARIVFTLDGACVTKTFP